MGSKNTISENDLIKNSCKIECRWEHEKKQWVIKIRHITDDISYSSVQVIMEGFENFREACDEAVLLFKRNIRNGIKEKQTVKAVFRTEDIWPEYIVET